MPSRCLLVLPIALALSCGSNLESQWDVHLASGDELVLVRPIGDAL